MEKNKNYTEQYKPITAWGYVGYSILYTIPVIGLIFLLIHTFNKDNINRRNYARSYWAAALLTIIIMVIAGIILYFVLKSIDVNEIAKAFESVESAIINYANGTTTVTVVPIA